MSSRAVLDPHPIEFFRPFVLTQDLRPNAAPIVREGRIIFDNSMPAFDVYAYEAPAWHRLGKPSPFREREYLPMFLRRQAA